MTDHYTHTGVKPLGTRPRNWWFVICHIGLLFQHRTGF